MRLKLEQVGAKLQTQKDFANKTKIKATRAFKTIKVTLQGLVTNISNPNLRALTGQALDINERDSFSVWQSGITNQS
jgi:hypothetical protein